MAYLDENGLEHFWGKIKDRVSSAVAPKADDSAVVHKTDNETVAGTKTFSSQIAGTIGKSVGDGGYADMVQTFQSDNNGYRSCTIRCTNGDGYNEMLLGVHNEANSVPKGFFLKNTAGTLTGEFDGSLRLTRTTDAAGTVDKSPALSIGSISGEHLELDGNEIMAKSSGTTTGTLLINGEGGDVYIGGYTENYKSVTGRGKGSSTVPVYTDANGIVTACGSSLGVDISGNAATATELATARTINGVLFDGSANITVEDSTKVSKSGDTMTGDLTISSNSPNLFLQNTLIERGTAPSSNKTTTEILGKDKNDKNAWALYHTYETDKTHRIRLLCYNGLTTDNTYAEIGIGYDSDGNPYTNAPTPSSTTDSTTKIATTRWVRTATGNFACNAATATAFASSKTVTLTGAVTGEASSTGGWTVSTLWRSCTLGRNDSGTSNPWYKIASRTLTGGSTNYQITFYVENCNTVDKFSGILRINVSTNSSRIVDSSSNIDFTWIVNNGFNVEDFVFVCPTTAQPTVEIWARIARGYLKRRFTVISEGTAVGAAIGWTLYNSVSAGQEASITTQGTQIVSTNKTIANAQIDALFS